jgi:hypothetical protein
VFSVRCPVQLHCVALENKLLILFSFHVHWFRIKLIKYLNNWMHKRPSWEDDSRCASQEIPCLFWKPHGYHPVRKSPPLGPDHSRWLQSTAHFLDVRFSIFLCTHITPGRSLSFRFSDKNFVPPHLSFLEKVEGLVCQYLVTSQFLLTENQRKLKISLISEQIAVDVETLPLTESVVTLRQRKRTESHQSVKRLATCETTRLWVPSSLLPNGYWG